jgi:hypothetical protein
MPDNCVKMPLFIKKNPSQWIARGLHVESFDNKEIAIWLRNGKFPTLECVVTSNL